MEICLLAKLKECSFWKWFGVNILISILLNCNYHFQFVFVALWFSQILSTDGLLWKLLLCTSTYYIIQILIDCSHHVDFRGCFNVWLLVWQSFLLVRLLLQWFHCGIPLISTLFEFVIMEVLRLKINFCCEFHVLFIAARILSIFLLQSIQSTDDINRFGSQ
jgi:hypothetical protein